MATRDAYGKALAELGAKYDFYVLDADLAGATKTSEFKKAFPERFFDMGIAEANMVGVAAGMSTCGKPVFCSSFAAFAAGRAYDQVRNAVAYPHCNVKVVASHGGLMVAQDGATHQCLEDLALMRVIPTMTVLHPCDTVSTKALIEAVLNFDGPCYVRTSRLSVPEVYAEGEKFEIGKGKVLKEGNDVTIIAIGDMVSNALEAAKILEAEGIKATVVDMFTIKPIDEKLIVELAQKTGAMVTCEDHNVIGGLGGAVAEVLCANKPCPLERIGSQDMFGKSATPAELQKMYGMTAEDIANAAKKAIARK